MANLFDYLAWRGDLSFKASPFNPVDNIIFSQLAYLTFDGIVPGPEEKEGISIALAVRIFDENLHSPDGIKLTSMFKEDPVLIRALASSRRFGNCQLFGFVNNVNNDREIQFSALCISIDDGTTYMAFRGTDTSIIGWKEDFNMSFKEAVPAQIEAVKYLEKMAARIKGRLRIGGHSKGGNLAIYSSAFCRKKIKRRITDIYNNDAPGFNEKVISSKGFKEIKNKIRFFVPQSSIIGMFLEHGSDYTVIKSSESGLLQHNLYSWEVTHNDLVRVDEVTAGSRYVNKTIRDWITALDNEHREQFIEALFLILSEANVNTIRELEKTWVVSAGRMLRKLNNINESTKKLIWETIRELIRSAGRNIDTFFNPENQK